MSLPVRILIVAALQTVALAGMVAAKQWTLATGTPVVLETRPVDPRSLFRGDYVRLNYAISRLDLDSLDGDNAFHNDDTLYVVLRPGEPYWQPVAVYREHPGESAEGVIIRGTVRSTLGRRRNPETREMEDRRTVFARYGIENYFVPEGEGRALERPREGERIDIQVAVDARGGAGILGVLVNGEQRYVESLF